MQRHSQNAGMKGLSEKDFREAKHKFEVAYLTKQLVSHRWNVSRTAATIGLHRQSLQEKLRELGFGGRAASRGGGSRGKKRERSLHFAARHRSAVEGQERAAAVGMTAMGVRKIAGNEEPKARRGKKPGDAGGTEGQLRHIVGLGLGRLETIVGE